MRKERPVLLPQGLGHLPVAVVWRLGSQRLDLSVVSGNAGLSLSECPTVKGSALER
jgi:hypothetical protein